jgi:hypothetical protein
MREEFWRFVSPNESDEKDEKAQPPTRRSSEEQLKPKTESCI